MKTAVILALFVSTAAHSQDSTIKKDPVFTAMSVGFPSLDGDGAMSLVLFTFGASFTQLRNGALSPDFAIGTMPILWTQQTKPIWMRAGLALPMQTSSGTYVVPSAGITSFSFLGTSAGGSASGLNAGIAIVGKIGGRVGITWHRFSDSATVMLIEIGSGGFSR